MPDYKPNLGIVALPTYPASGYVYFPDTGKWLIHSNTPLKWKGQKLPGISKKKKKRMKTPGYNGSEGALQINM